MMQFNLLGLVMVETLGSIKRRQAIEKEEMQQSLFLFSLVLGNE